MGTFRLFGGGFMKKMRIALVSMTSALCAVAVAIPVARGSDSAASKADAVEAAKSLTPLSEDEVTRLLQRPRRTVDVGDDIRSGTPTSVELLKATTPNMVLRYLKLQCMPQASDQRNVQVLRATAEATMRELFHPQVVAAQTADVLRGIESRATTPAMEMMQEVALDKLRWNRVEAGESTAIVVFSAETRRRTESAGWIHESQKQFQMKLQLDGLAWRVSDLQILNLGSQG